MTFEEKIVYLQNMVNDVNPTQEASTNPEDFVCNEMLGSFLHNPAPALGGDVPINILDTDEGFERVKNVLGAILDGVFL